MDRSKVSASVRKVTVGVLHWVFAAVIAGSIAWLISRNFLETHNNRDGNCDAKPCYRALDARVDKLEAGLKAEIAAKTDKRYRADDAERDQRILRAEMNAIHGEINQRIDRLHNEIHNER